MSSLEDGEYAELLEAIERAQHLIQTLEAAPRSNKRDTALKLLHDRHTAALTRLRDLQSDSHSN